MLNLFDERFHTQKLPAFATWCSIIGIPLAIISILLAVLDTGIMLAILIATFLLIMYALASIIYQISTRIKEEKLNRRIGHINTILADKNNRRIAYRKHEKIKKELIAICDKIAFAFREARGRNFRVCIKQILIKNDELYVQTIVRDSRTSAHDKQANGFDKQTDKLNDNRDFVDILSAADSILDTMTDITNHPIYFLSNDLSIEQGYYNSHLSADFHTLADNGNKQKHSEWPLNYRSTIVTPVLSTEKNIINGFMCIDCDMPKAFNPQDDITNLWFIAIHMSLLVEKAVRSGQRSHKS